MEKNANNKVNRWSLELPTYSITFEWISGARNKAADCLSWLVKPSSTLTSVNMLTASHTDRPAFNTRSNTQHTSPSTTSTPHPNICPKISQETTLTPKPHSGQIRSTTANAENRPILQVYLQMIIKR